MPTKYNMNIKREKKSKKNKTFNTLHMNKSIYFDLNFFIDKKRNQNNNKRIFHCLHLLIFAMLE